MESKPKRRSVLAMVMTGCLLVGASYAAFGAQDSLVKNGRKLQDAVKVGSTMMADSVDPKPGSTAWALISHGIAEKLFTLNKQGEIIPQIGDAVARESDLVWQVRIKSVYKFSDGTTVTAQHVADCLNEMNTENDSGSASIGAMTVTAVDDVTVRIESTIATADIRIVLAEWVFPVYLADADAVGGFIFTGPYKVAHYEQGDHMDLVPNTEYPQADERLPIEFKKYADGDALATAVGAGSVDLGFHLPVDSLTDLRSTSGVHIKSFEVGYHYMMFHNMRGNKAHMTDVKVRNAIDLAIDRNALSQALRAGKGTRSLFPSTTPYYLDGDTHGDAAAAGALLDEAGWTLVEGKRTKAGEVLTIDLVAYPHRPGLGIMQPVIAQALTALGITVNEIMTSDEWSDTSTRMDNGDFDLLMWAQNTLPAGDPAWFLNSFFSSNGGNNHAGIESTEVDGLLTTMSSTEDPTARVEAAAAAHAAILAQQPVSNLVTPEWHVSLSDRMNDFGYEPWGSDYYVIRADLFVTGSGAYPDSDPADFAIVIADSGASAAALALCLALFY